MTAAQRRRRRPPQVVRKATPLPNASEIGTSGLKHRAGIVQEEFLIQLRGRQGVRIFQEMRDNDATVGAFLYAISKLICNVPWNVEAPSDNAEDIEPAEFLESCLDDMSHSWSSVIDEILSMLTFGWSWHEILYKRRVGPEESDPAKRSKFSDNRIGWRKMPIRAQETLLRWDIEDDGGIRGWTQVSPQNGKKLDLTIEQSLLFRTSAHKNNPEGRSILRNAYRSWFFKKRIEENEGVGIERDLAGIPVAYVPGMIMDDNAPAEQKAIYDSIKDTIADLRNDRMAGVILPSDVDPESKKRLYEVELLTTGGQRQFDTTKIINRYDQRILMSVLADFIMLGHEKVGSFALSSDKTDLFALAVASVLGSIQDVLNRFAVPRLFRLNTFSIDQPPMLKHGEIEKEDVEKFVTNVVNAVGGGLITPGPALEDKLRETLELPDRESDGIDDEFFEMDRERKRRMAEELARAGNEPPDDDEEEDDDDPDDDA